jgi:hypothetical protein
MRPPDGNWTESGLLPAVYISSGYVSRTKILVEASMAVETNNSDTMILAMGRTGKTLSLAKRIAKTGYYFGLAYYFKCFRGRNQDLEAS